MRPGDSSAIWTDGERQHHVKLPLCLLNPINTVNFTQIFCQTLLLLSCSSPSTPHTQLILMFYALTLHKPLQKAYTFVIHDDCEVLLESFCTAVLSHFCNFGEKDKHETANGWKVLYLKMLSGCLVEFREWN